MLFGSKAAAAPVSDVDAMRAIGAAMVEEVGGRKARRAFEALMAEIVEDSETPQGDFVLDAAAGAVISAGIDRFIAFIRKRAATEGVDDGLEEDIRRKTEIVYACSRAHEQMKQAHQAFQVRRKDPATRRGVYVTFINQAEDITELDVNRNWIACESGPVLYDRLRDCSKDNREAFQRFYDLFCDQFAGVITRLDEIHQAAKNCHDVYVRARATRAESDVTDLQVAMTVMVDRWRKFSNKLRAIAGQFNALERDLGGTERG